MTEHEHLFSWSSHSKKSFSNLSCFKDEMILNVRKQKWTAPHIDLLRTTSCFQIFWN